MRIRAYLVVFFFLIALSACGGGGGSDSTAGAAGSGSIPAVNQAPSLTAIGDKTIGENETLTFTVSATDPDGNALTYSAQTLPEGATFDPATQTFTWTPTFVQAGVYPYILFMVTDNGSPALSASEEITITVGNVNRAPVFTPIPDIQTDAEHRRLIQFTVAAADPDDDAIAYSTSALPPGAEFNAETLQFTYNLPEGTPDSYWDVTFYATDSGSPPMQGSLQVIMKFGDNPNPGSLIDYIVAQILASGLPKNIENSYWANLKDAQKFYYDGKSTYALNQMQAFITKLQVDAASGLISRTFEARFVGLAKGVCYMLQQ